MSDQARARRLAVRIRQIAAATLEFAVKDPRLALVTVTDATLTGDLRVATVFYTVYGDEAAQRESAAALASVTGLVRSAIGRQLGTRFTPEVSFSRDGVPVEARHIEELLAAATERDAALAALREGAVPAGEADPYRHDDD